MPGIKMPPLKLSCPHCSKSVEASLRDLKPITVLSCPHCVKKIVVSTPGLQETPEDEIVRTIKGDGLPN